MSSASMNDISRSSWVNSGCRSARRSSSRKQRAIWIVAVVAGDHQDLLVELRRLRQGVERARLDAAGHQIIAGAFGRAAAEHRRLDVDEALLVAVVPHDLDHPVPQEHGPLHLRPAEVEVAIFQPQVLAGHSSLWVERRRAGSGRAPPVARRALRRAGLQLRVHGSLGPRRHLAADLHDEFGAQRLRRLSALGAAVRGEDHLRPP